MLSEHGIGDARGLMLNDPESEWHLRAPAAGDGTPLAHSAPPVSPSLGGAIRLLLWVTGLGYHQGEEIGAEDSCCSIIMQYHAFSCIICQHESFRSISMFIRWHGPSMSIMRILNFRRLCMLSEHGRWRQGFDVEWSWIGMASEGSGGWRWHSPGTVG